MVFDRDAPTAIACQIMFERVSLGRAEIGYAVV